MFERLERGWNFAKTGFEILNEHKLLIIFPLAAMLANALILVTFLFPLGGIALLIQAAEQAEAANETLQNIGLFVFYLINYFVVIFFNAALVGSLSQALDGEEPTLAHGFSVAVSRLPQILGWAVVSAVVGVLLNALERHRKIGSFVASLIGGAWAAMAFFVLPVLVIERVGPITAVKRSVEILRKSWGEGLTTNLAIGLIGFLLALPGGLLLFLGFASAQPLVIALGALWVLLAVAASSTADITARVLLYRWATDAPIATHIVDSDFEGAFRAQ